MDYTGISTASKLRIEKLVHAIRLGDLTNVYVNIREVDTRLHQDFTRFVASNNLPGRDIALKWLRDCDDSLTAVRSAAVSLLVAEAIKQSGE